MRRVGVWTITDRGPRRLASAMLDLEQQLEDWLERDPSLLEPGLTIVGRQIRVDTGLLDLLALDPQGRWVVIEIKRDTLRRDTIAQGIDYAASVATMPATELATKVNAYLATQAAGRTLESLLKDRTGESGPGEMREVAVYVVGTGRDAGLERMIDFLSTGGINVRAVTFDAFAVGTERVLVRELTESESSTTAESGLLAASPDAILAQADPAMVPALRRLLAEAHRHGLVARPWKSCIMLAPGRHRGRALITVWPAPLRDGRVKLYLSPEMFAEFFPVTEAQVTAALQQPGGSRPVDAAAVERVAKGLSDLFHLMESAPT